MTFVRHHMSVDRRQWRDCRLLETIVASEPDRGVREESMETEFIVDPSQFSVCLANLVTMGMDSACREYISLLPPEMHMEIVAQLLDMPSNYRDFCRDAILDILSQFHMPLSKYPDSVRKCLTLWAMNRYLRPKKIVFDSPYIPFILSPLAAELFKDDLYTEFHYLLRTVETCPTNNETYCVIPELSDAIISYLQANEQEILFNSPGSGKYLLFWIMFHIVTAGHCHAKILLQLARDYTYTDEILVCYYPLPSRTQILTLLQEAEQAEENELQTPERSQ